MTFVRGIFFVRTKRCFLRKRFVGLIRQEVAGGAVEGKNFIENAPNSRILKKLTDGDHPALENEKENNSEGGTGKSDDFGPFELSVNEISINPNAQLGAGAFGVVHRGICRGKEVAVKTLKNAQFDPKALEEFKRECMIMR